VNKGNIPFIRAGAAHAEGLPAVFMKILVSAYDENIFFVYGDINNAKG